MSQGRGRPSQRTSNAIQSGLAVCSTEAQHYGACIRAVLPDVDKGVCEREFQALKACMRKALRAALAKTK